MGKHNIKKYNIKKFYYHENSEKKLYVCKKHYTLLLLTKLLL